METKKMKEAKRTRRAVIVGNGPYGLYYGQVEATDEEVLQERSVRVYECRHIARWKGGRGGITALAATGPDADGSLIGAACPSSLLTDVKAIHDVSDAAQARFSEVHS